MRSMRLAWSLMVLVPGLAVSCGGKSFTYKDDETPGGRSTGGSTGAALATGTTGASGTVGGAAGTNGSATLGGAGGLPANVGLAGELAVGGAPTGGHTGLRPGAAVGQACKVASDCQSGNCEGSICCEEGCKGACQKCSSTGRCEVRKSDTSCKLSPCTTADTECSSYADADSTNNCDPETRACRTCVATPAPRGLTCTPPLVGRSVHRPICDGKGRCGVVSKLPTQPECGVDGAFCWDNANHTAPTCLMTAVSEPFRRACGDKNFLMCASTSECAIGEVCCLSINLGDGASGQTTSTCRTLSQCFDQAKSPNTMAGPICIGPGACSAISVGVGGGSNADIEYHGRCLDNWIWGIGRCGDMQAAGGGTAGEGGTGGTGIGGGTMGGEAGNGLMAGSAASLDGDS